MDRWQFSSGFKILVLLALSAPRAASALTIDWNRQLGTGGFDYSAAVAAHGSESVYMAGTTSGNLAAEFAGGYYDAFVTRYSSTGTPMWTRQIGSEGWDEATGVVTDEVGNVYVAGYTSGLLGTSRLGSSDSFVTSYNAAGDRLWTSQFAANDHPFSVQYTTGIAADGLGSLYVTGYALAHNSTSGVDAFVTKLDTSGNVLWTRQFGSNLEDSSYSISADSLGNVFVAGLTRGDMHGTNQGFADAFVSKLDSAGNVAWSRQLGANSWDFGYAVAADGLGNAYLGGATESDLSGEGLAGPHSALLAKYDGNGTMEWIRQLGGGGGSTEAFSIAIDADHGAYITGNTDNLPGSTPTGGNSFLAQYDAAGALLWAKELGHDGGKALSIGGDGDLYVSGGTYKDLDGFNAGREDAFLTKVSVNPEPAGGVMAAMVGSLLAAMRRRRVFPRQL
jgi:hypothetical protein